VDLGAAVGGVGDVGVDVHGGARDKSLHNKVVTRRVMEAFRLINAFIVVVVLFEHCYCIVVLINIFIKVSGWKTTYLIVIRLQLGVLNDLAQLTGISRFKSIAFVLQDF
jgi:hypothetical protein